MKKTFAAAQDIEFKVPDFPKMIIITNGSMLPIESLSEANIVAIFDSMKENALEYVKGKKVVQTTVTGANASNVSNAQASHLGRKLVETLSGK